MERPAGRKDLCRADRSRAPAETEVLNPLSTASFGRSATPANQDSDRSLAGAISGDKSGIIGIFSSLLPAGVSFWRSE